MSSISAAGAAAISAVPSKSIAAPAAIMPPSRSAPPDVSEAPISIAISPDFSPLIIRDTDTRMNSAAAAVSG